jgi:hypothetical protein
MTKIRFKFQGKERTHEFFFGIRPGINGFSIRDDRGIIHDCLFQNGVVNIYGNDSDVLEERSQAAEI